jgi:hypothetical protein
MWRRRQPDVKPLPLVGRGWGGVSCPCYFFSAIPTPLQTYWVVKALV